MMPERSVKRSTKSCRIMFLHRLVDWLAKSLSTCWKLIWSFASGTACPNSAFPGDVPSRNGPFPVQQPHDSKLHLLYLDESAQTEVLLPIQHSSELSIRFFAPGGITG